MATVPPAEDDAPTVRPYTLTGGRTRTRAGEPPLALEALVRAVPPAPVPPAGPAAATGTTTPEGRAILRRCAERYLSVAELSAHLALPLGVVRVLVGDLRDAGRVSVQEPGAGAAGAGDPTDPQFLRSVLDGLSTL
ncbi:DUF742 domain-containing protein [Vallicoccus soli]|uniref:DUF742 domain-containing protein n=1 Tax=Vallicoccus soli TaxID=2339232 RepID=A0A3A3Z4G5_9ACTN|nr:DUF742 domain-containing protein [Vallicoccus soli]